MRRKSKDNRILSGRIVAVAFLFVFLVGAFGLATVGLRQQIATSASKAVAMERRLVELNRFEGKYTGEIAMALSPSFLEAQNQRFNLGLRQPNERQVIRVDSETQIHFAERRWNQVASLQDEHRFTFRTSNQ